MKLKNIVLSVAILCVLFALVGCAGESNTADFYEPIQGDQIGNSSGNEMPEDYNSDVRDEATKIVVSLKKATDFSEETAWVKYTDPYSGAEKIGLMNTSGKITTTDDLTTLADFGAEFSDGYSYVNIKDNDVDCFYILDTNGKITAQSPEDGTSYRIITGGDGIYLVYQMIRGMETNEDRYGFIDAGGNWIVKPTVNNPLVYGYKDAGHGDELKYLYLGEHVFLALMEGYPYNKYAFYNVDLGTYTTYQDDKNVYFEDDDGNPYKYSNGLVLHWTEKYVYSFDTAGERVLEMELEKEGWGTAVRYGEGIFFTGIVDYYNESVMKNGAFYDLRGNKIIDLSKYTFVLSDANGFYEFHNGVAAVKILGADGEYYISHIDLSGEFLYDPIKIDHSSNMVGHGNASGGALYIMAKLTEERVVLHIDGTTCKIPSEVEIWSMYSKQPEREFAFKDGYAWCSNNMYFIGVDGQKLTAYLET